MRTFRILSTAAAFSLSLSLMAQTQPTTQPAAPPLPEFSADVHMIHNGQVFQKGKLYMSKGAVRMEMAMPGAPMSMTHIQRMDKGVLYMMMPNKTYMEQPLPYNPMTHHEIPAGWTQSCGPGEIVDNHPTEKCVMTGLIGGKQTTTTIWKAKDLNGAVIRNLGDQGAGMEFKNIVAGPQPAALFEPPADYRKMDLKGFAPPPSQNR